MAENDSSTLGAGTDSISVTGTSAGQTSTSGGYTPAPAAAPRAAGGAAGALSGVRERAGGLKDTLADKLHQGAQALRQPAGGQQFAGGAAVADDDQVQRIAIPAANAMDKTADLLRNGLDLRGAVEEQVRTSPGRTLLIALGLGYVLGKAIRR